MRSGCLLRKRERNCHNFPVHVFVKITFEFQKAQSKRKNLLENWDGIAGMRGMFVKNEWVTKITQHNFPVSSLIFTGWTDDIHKSNCDVDDIDVALVLVYFWRISDGTDVDCCCCCWVWKFNSANFWYKNFLKMQNLNTFFIKLTMVQ